MNIDKIPDILDLSMAANKIGKVFNPMFIGEAGIGKSEGIHQWVREQRKIDPEFGFIDLRIAYYEGPDFVGYPYQYKDESGRERMGHALPHFWPTSGRGLILLEEPNRGNTMVMNCLMQLLTDRAVGPNYKLPPGYIVAAAINPEGSKYDVNSMDTALRDRFEEFHVEYSFNAFMSHIESTGWHKNVVQYLKSGIWVYKASDHIEDKGGGHYVSPRTWSKMNAAELAGASGSPAKRNLHYITCLAVLGKHTGNEYWKACWDDAPVTAQDILNDKVAAIKKLADMAKAGNSYAGDKISLTVDSLVDRYGGFYEGRKKGDKDLPHEEGTIDESTMVDIAKLIPADHAVNLIKGCAMKVHRGGIQLFFKEFVVRHPECVAMLRDHLKIARITEKK